MGTAFDELVVRAGADPEVVGLVLTGSVARGMATGHSDTDVCVIVPGYGGRWTESVRTPELDTIVVSLGDLADVSDRWQRYAFRGARVLLDRLDGRVADLVRAQGTPTGQEARQWARADLDGYLNFVYRAAKSSREGRDEAARMDEIEAGPWFLWTLFDLYGRVRPYNKYLRWELDTYPLPPPWTAGHLIGTVLDRPSRLFGELETVARAAGCGDVLDGWAELDLIRDYGAGVR